MREIKFRAWDTETKEMNYDFLSKNWLLVCIQSPYVELMQYTGLKDKNGKEIYEGDIATWFVNGISRTAPVYYDTEQACFWMGKEVNGKGGMVLNDWYRGEYEVIGNIYENPHLLEKESTDANQ